MEYFSNSFSYDLSVKPPENNPPIRQFGLHGLNLKVTVVAPDTIQNEKVLKEIEQLRQTIAEKSEPKLMAIVDVQNDFVTGSLRVKGSDQIFAKIKEMVKTGEYDAIILTADNHPKDHVSFATNHPHTEPFIDTYTVPENDNIPQIAWPEHCVQGSFGVELEPRLIEILKQHLDRKVPIFLFPKGEGLSETYSAGENVAGKALPYQDFLKILASEKRITVDHVGVAADYCVASTAKSTAKVANVESRVIGEGTVAVCGKNGMQTGSPLSEEQIKDLYDHTGVIHIAA